MPPPWNEKKKSQVSYRLLPTFSQIPGKVSYYISSSKYTYLPISLDPGEFFASKSLRLLGGGVFEKKKEYEKKKTCLILSFGDYYKNVWCPALIFLYRLFRFTYFCFIYLFFCICTNCD